MIFEENKIINVSNCFWRKKREQPVSCIYKITSPSGKIYIGCSKDIENRFYSYRLLDCKKQKRLFHSLNKYGFDNHIFEILKIINSKGLTEVELIELLKKEEIEYIKKYNSFIDDNINGLNLTKGGELGQLSKESRIKIGNAHRGKKTPDWLKEKLRLANTGRKHTEEAKDLIRKSSLNRTAESRLKISEYHKGNKHNLGKKASAEARQNMSNAHKGIIHTEESKAKMRLAQKGKIVSEETKEKIRKSLIGRKNNSGYKISLALKGRVAHNKGIPMSEEQKLKISLSNKGRIVNDETKSKISEANKGRKMTAEQTNKWRMSMIGKPTWNKGKKASEEAKLNQSIARKKYFERVKQEKLSMIF
jgi:group I intron endonuclease